MNPIIQRILNPVTEDKKKPQRPPSQWRNKWSCAKKLKLPGARKHIGPGDFFTPDTYTTRELAEQGAYNFASSNASWIIAAQDQCGLMYLGPEPVEG